MVVPPVKDAMARSVINRENSGPARGPEGKTLSELGVSDSSVCFSARKSQQGDILHARAKKITH